ncbi:hypothetical protein AHAS_Ahas13G0275000 [Arachis hypogaea]
MADNQYQDGHTASEFELEAHPKVHGQRERLEQLEHKAERQDEAERELRREVRRRRELEEKLLKLEADLRNQSNRTYWEENPLGGEDPFVEEIMRARVPRNFKTPDMDLYVGTTDPRHHVSNFKSRMYFTNASDATRYKAFPTTLTKAVMKWFDNLPPRSVTCFDDLARKFLTKFSSQKNKVKHASSLLGIKQEVGETLRDYMGRSNKACLEIHNFPTEAIIMALVNGLKEGPFSQSISKRHPTSLYKVQERAEKYSTWKKSPACLTRLGKKRKKPRKRRNIARRKLADTITTLLYKSPLWMSIGRYVIPRNFHCLILLSIRRPEVRTSVANTTSFMGIQQMTSTT